MRGVCIAWCCSVSASPLLAETSSDALRCAAFVGACACVRVEGWGCVHAVVCEAPCSQACPLQPTARPRLQICRDVCIQRLHSRGATSCQLGTQRLKSVTACVQEPSLRPSGEQAYPRRLPKGQGLTAQSRGLLCSRPCLKGCKQRPGRARLPSARGGTARAWQDSAQLSRQAGWHGS